MNEKVILLGVLGSLRTPFVQANSSKKRKKKSSAFLGPQHLKQTYRISSTSVAMRASKERKRAPSEDRIPVLQRIIHLDEKLRPSDRTPSQQISSFCESTPGTRIQTKPDNNPAWFVSRKANVKRSLVYQIPADIFLLILDHTEGVTREVMRGTCGLFLHFIANIDFRRIDM